MKLRLAEAAILLLAMAWFVAAAKADNSDRGVSNVENSRSFPPDTHNYVRPAIPEDFDPLKTRGKVPAVDGAGSPKRSLGRSSPRSRDAEDPQKPRLRYPKTRASLPPPAVRNCR